LVSFSFFDILVICKRVLVIAVVRCSTDDFSATCF
jgi:hypothetical protein